jgi:hypothetical protein
VPRMESPSTRSWCRAKCRAKCSGGDLIIFLLGFYAMAIEKKSRFCSDIEQSGWSLEDARYTTLGVVLSISLTPYLRGFCAGAPVLGRALTVETSDGVGRNYVIGPSLGDCKKTATTTFSVYRFSSTYPSVRSEELP